MKIAENITELIGKTPLLELKALEKENGSLAKIVAKLELFNPAGSAKDRIAMAMIEDAEKKGILKKGGVIIEPTSGNTGIGLACIGSAKGYRVILTMPDTMSAERINLIRAYGAEVVLTDGKDGMNGAIEKAQELHKKTEGSIIAGQFVNLQNPFSHYMTTAPEIWEAAGGKIDIFVAGVGTGGTISGVAKFLKEKNPAIKIVGVEPFSSPVISAGRKGPHGLQGIGAGFIPDTLDTKILDRIITVKEEDAYETGRFIARNEGVLVGISSGAAAYAAALLSKEEENRGKTIIVLLPDSGERYLSTPMFG